MSLLQSFTDPNVQKFLVPVGLGMLTIALGWLVNQLPPLRNVHQGWKVLWVTIKAAISVVLIGNSADALEVMAGNDKAKQLAGITFVIVLVALLIGIAVDIWKLIRTPASAETIAPDLTRNDRLQATLMDSVRHKWIYSVLENPNSLYQRSRLELGLQEQPEWVRHWLSRGQRESNWRALPPGTRIVDEFEKLGRGATLLILGEPGGGKTTLLLELARDLLDRRIERKAIVPVKSLETERQIRSAKLTQLRLSAAIEAGASVKFQLEQEIAAEELRLQQIDREIDLALGKSRTNSRTGIPVVLNLSSWGALKTAGKEVVKFEDWLIEELYINYLVNQSLGRAWIQNDELLLLLDGLDEVKQEYRDRCVTAIHEFHQQHMAIEMVVCCRIQDYQALSNRLTNFRESVVVLPLALEQVDDYLRQAGTQLDRFREAIWQDKKLQHLASRPLFLAIAALAYQNHSADELINLSEQQQLKILFDRYVERMFVQRPMEESDQKQMIRWLGILARQMGTKKEFLIERMQPTEWLSSVPKWQYRVMIGTMIGLIIWLIIELIYKLPLGWINESDLKLSMAAGLTFGTILGLTGALDSIYLIEALKISRLGRFDTQSREKLLLGMFGGMMTGGPIGALIVGLIFALKADIQKRTIPNQGIWNSFHNMLLTGSANIILSIALYKAGITRVVLDAICLPLLATFTFGGALTCLQHGILRLVLYWAKRIPWNWVIFFKQAEDRLFIQQIGGSFIFVHRYLQEHFAER